MKLLFFGSLLVVVGVIALAAVEWRAMSAALDDQAPGRQPEIRLVVGAGGPRPGAEPPAVVWQTSTAPHDCSEVLDRRRRNEARRVADLLDSVAEAPERRVEHDPCADFQGGKVDDGTRVELLDDCGGMARVRILSGPLRGREGCIEAARLGAARP